jgi:hypothetical protein
VTGLPGPIVAALYGQAAGAQAVGGQAGGIPMVVADTKGNDQGSQGEDFGKSTPVGFVVLLLFFVAVVFLVRSMTKHLKRVPASFDPPDQDTVSKTSTED